MPTMGAAEVITHKEPHRSLAIWKGCLKYVLQLIELAVNYILYFLCFIMLSETVGWSGFVQWVTQFNPTRNNDRGHQGANVFT